MNDIVAFQHRGLHIYATEHFILKSNLPLPQMHRYTNELSDKLLSALNQLFKCVLTWAADYA